MFSTQGLGIAYGNGTWVAGGYGTSNTLAYSTDGNTWTGLGKSIIGTGVFDVKYANGLWVAGGQAGATTGANTIATSPDGIVWTGRGKNIITSGVEKVTYGNGLWMVGGSGGNTIATSTNNGITWAGQNNTFASYIAALTYGNGKFVAIGYGGVVGTSTNGFSWGLVNPNIDFGASRYLAYGNGLFVAVSDGTNSNTIATSPDGITWTGRGKQFFNNYSGEGIAYGTDDAGNPLWVAVGSKGTTTPANTFATSSDGITWVGRGTNFITDTAKKVAYNTSFGPEETLFLPEPTNTNAPNFVNAPGLSAANYLGTAISADGKYILICKSGTTNTAIFFSSNNGVSFAALSSSTFSTSTNWQCCAMSSTGQIMVIAGLSSNIYKSTDYGVTWTPIGSVLNWMTLHLSYTGQYCLATSQTTTNVYSTVFSNFLINSTSTQYTTFTTISNANRFPQSAYVSSAGKYMIVTCYGISNGLATSSNYGSTWAASNYGIPSGTINNPYNYWGATITYDETKIYIGVYSGASMGVYILPITGGAIGTTSTKISSYAALATTQIESILVSRDGTYIIVSNDSTTHYSKDSGATWTLCYTGFVQCSSMSEGAKTVITTDYYSSIPKISKT